MFEISPSGRVLRRIEPSLNPEQIKAKGEEAERRKEAEKAAIDQKRKDLALLNTYSTSARWTVARDRNIEPIAGRISSAKERLQVVAKREKQVEEELEFYKAGKASAGKAAREAPPALVSEMERIKGERELLSKSIVAHEKEIAELRSKYEGDKQRWIALKSGVVAKPAEYIPQDPPKPDPRQAPLLLLARAQPAPQDLAHLGGIGLAGGRLHHLADERVEGLLLAGAVVLHEFRLRGDHLVDGRLERARVRDLLQPALVDDRVRLALAARHREQHVFRRLRGDGGVVDAVEDLRERRR
jgi:hypothetical protein